MHIELSPVRTAIVVVALWCLALAIASAVAFEFGARSTLRYRPPTDGIKVINRFGFGAEFTCGKPEKRYEIWWKPRADGECYMADAPDHWWWR